MWQLFLEGLVLFIFQHGSGTMNTTEEGYTWPMSTVAMVHPGGSQITLAEQIQEVLYYLIGSVAMTGNLFVIIVIFQYTKMRSVPTNILVINQSFIDGIAGLFLILTRRFQYRYDWPLYGITGEVFCRVWAARIPLWGLLESSTYNLLALSLERYIAIVHPITHRVSITRIKMTIVIVFVWLFGFILQILYKASSVIYYVKLLFLSIII